MNSQASIEFLIISLILFSVVFLLVSSSAGVVGRFSQGMFKINAKSVGEEVRQLCFLKKVTGTPQARWLFCYDDYEVISHDGRGKVIGSGEVLYSFDCACEVSLSLNKGNCYAVV